MQSVQQEKESRPMVTERKEPGMQCGRHKNGNAQNSQPKKNITKTMPTWEHTTASLPVTTEWEMWEMCTTQKQRNNLEDERMKMRMQ